MRSPKQCKQSELNITALQTHAVQESPQHQQAVLNAQFLIHTNSPVRIAIGRLQMHFAKNSNGIARHSSVAVWQMEAMCSYSINNMNPIIKDWHNPHNIDCHQNHYTNLDCTCKRPLTRKPYKVARVNDRDHGSVVLEIHPDGRLVLREKGRKFRLETTIGAVYDELLWKQAKGIAVAKRKAKLDRKKARRTRK